MFVSFHEATEIKRVLLLVIFSFGAELASVCSSHVSIFPKNVYNAIFAKSRRLFKPLFKHSSKGISRICKTLCRLWCSSANLENRNAHIESAVTAEHCMLQPRACKNQSAGKQRRPNTSFK